MGPDYFVGVNIAFKQFATSYKFLRDGQASFISNMFNSLMHSLTLMAVLRVAYIFGC